VLLKYGVGFDQADPEQFAWILFATTAATTVVWIAVTLLTPPEPRATLLAFYRRVRPNPRFWGPVVLEARETQGDRDGLFSFANWAGGVVLIYAALFGIGNLVLGRTGAGAAILAVGLAAGGFLYWNLERRGWATLD
jgi:hypothetical protein